jgi:hypothetical protein
MGKMVGAYVISFQPLLAGKITYHLGCHAGVSPSALAVLIWLSCFSIPIDPSGASIPLESYWGLNGVANTGFPSTLMVEETTLW